MKVNIYADGGARGNPGPAAIGVYIEDENKNKIHGHGEKIGISTNNVAEYKAIIYALSWLSENENFNNENTGIDIYTDSQLIFSQITGLYKIKDAKLRELLFEIREKEARINSEIRYFNIPRENNKKADLLVNMALDNKL